ncbi:hypothetical protein DRQ33_03705 [bacterium]|nr:MAG: hypothetical protein DRQ33_03705 [bacterium]
MNKIKLTFMFAFISVLLVCGCFGPTTVKLRPQFPTVTFPDKFPASVALYFDTEITSYIDRLHTTGDFCAGHSYDIPIGDGIVQSVTSAMETVFQNVSVLDTVPQPDEMKNFDAMIIVELHDIVEDVEITELIYGHKIKSTFQIYLKMKMNDSDMRLIYSHSPHSTGIKSDRITSCSDIGEIIGFSVEKSLSRISTDVAEAFYNSRQVADFVESLK